MPYRHKGYCFEMNAIYSIGYTFSSKGFVFILNYLAINFLLLHNYGEFSLIFSTINSFVVISGLGLLYSGSIISSKWMRRNKAYAFDYFKFSSYLIFALSFIFSLIYYFYCGYFFSVFFAIFFYSIATLFDGFFYGIGEIKKIFFYGILNLLFSIVLSILLIKYKGLDGAIYSIVFSKILLIFFQSILFFQKFKGEKINFKIKYKKQIFLFYRKNNIPLVLSALIATPVITFVIYILSLNKGLEDVAVFSWCYQIYLIGMFIPMALNSYYLSILNKKDNLGKMILIKKINSFNVFVCFFSIVILYLLSSYILRLGKIDHIYDAYIVFYGFLFCIFFYGINLGFLSFWSSVGKSKYHLKMQVLWSLVLVLVVGLLVNKLGALSIPIGMCAGFIMQYFFQKKEISQMKVV